MWHNNPSQEASIHAGLGIFPELTGTISSNTVAAMQESLFTAAQQKVLGVAHACWAEWPAIRITIITA